MSSDVKRSFQMNEKRVLFSRVTASSHNTKYINANIEISMAKFKQICRANRIVGLEYECFDGFDLTRILLLSDNSFLWTQ